MCLTVNMHFITGVYGIFIVYDPCHACEHKCNKRKAKCSCYSGYILASDGFSCLKCATANFNSESKEPTSPSWNVAICDNSNTSQPNHCSGTMISDQWVLTSADCVCKTDNTINVVVTNGACGTTEKKAGHSVVNIKCFSKYSSTVLNTNLALIKINTSTMLKEQHTIHPICVSNTKSKNTIKVGEHVMLFGWGNTTVSRYDNATLKVSNVTVAHAKECKPSFISEGVTTFKSTAIFCTHGNTTDSCNGSTGAGVVAVTDNGYLLLKGVISRSTKECGRPGSYTVHTRLSLKKVQSWIKRQTKP